MNWKSGPTDPTKRWLNKSLEIAVSFLCNWRCTACDALSQFPTISFIRKGNMTVGQIEHFIGEMHDQNAYIGRIRLVGGEPTMYGPLEHVCKLLHDELIVPGFIAQLEMITNGTNQERARGVKQWVNKVRVSDEGDKQKHHTASLVHTPLSLGYPGQICSAPFHCGMQLSGYGYFPCSSGSGIARLRDDMMRWQRLSLPTCEKPCNAVRETWPDLADLCGHCYHSLKPEHKIKCGTGMQPGQHALNAPSADVWEHLAPWIGGKQPDWKIYGQPVAEPVTA